MIVSIIMEAMKIIGVFVLAIAAGLSALVIKGLIEAKRSSVKEDYYADFSSPAPLEQKYSQPGEYDVSEIKIPYFMAAGTGETDDKGVADVTKEYAGVAPLASLVENYETIRDDVVKVRARATGAEHEDMLGRSDGYLTAWMLWQLCGDAEAASVFIGEKAEILHSFVASERVDDVARDAFERMIAFILNP